MSGFISYPFLKGQVRTTPAELAHIGWQGPVAHLGAGRSIALRSGIVGGPAAAPAFTGILDDFPNATVAYSFRKLRGAYAGSAVRIRRDNDNAESDIGFDANGDFDAAAAASFIGANNGFIVTWYDQSGNGDNLTQSTAGDQPAYDATGIGSLPGADFAGSAFMATTTDAVALNSTDVSVAAVGEMINPGTDSFGRLASMVANGQTEDFNNNTSAAFILKNSGDSFVRGENNGAKGNNLTDVNNNPTVFQSIFDGANHTMYVDGSGGTAVADTNTLGSGSGVTIALGRDAIDATGAAFWNGRISEVIIWATDQTANVSGIDSDMGTYYGI